MMHPPLTASLALALVACEPNIDDRVYDNTDYFPLDGAVRAAEYRAAEGGMDWTLLVEKVSSVEEDGVEVVTLEYNDADLGDLLWDVRWSSSSIHGVRIHGSPDVPADEDVEFDEPVVLVERGVQVEPVVTETSLGTFTASAATRDGCGTFWVDSWDGESCVVISLSDPDDDPSTHGIITGSYRLVPSYGAAWLDLDAWDDTWWMSDFEWED